MHSGAIRRVSDGWDPSIRMTPSLVGPINRSLSEVYKKASGLSRGFQCEEILTFVANEY